MLLSIIRSDCSWSSTQYMVIVTALLNIGMVKELRGDFRHQWSSLAYGAIEYLKYMMKKKPSKLPAFACLPDKFSYLRFVYINLMEAKSVWIL